MLSPRSWMSYALSCLAALSLVGCGDSSPTAPTRTQGPGPVTPSATFTVSGTISETAPTTHRRVDGVQVTLSSGQSASTGTNGAFTLTGVPSGTHTLTASRSEFETQSVSVTIQDANVDGIELRLSPTPRTVEEEHKGKLIPEDPSCHGTSRPCDLFPVGAHHSGTVRVFLIWDSADANLDIEVRCNGELVAESFLEGGVIEELITTVEGGRACEVALLHKGDATEYGVFLTYPY